MWDLIQRNKQQYWHVLRFAVMHLNAVVTSEIKLKQKCFVSVLFQM